jgi:hypothetical protein
MLLVYFPHRQLLQRQPAQDQLYRQEPQARVFRRVGRNDLANGLDYQRGARIGSARLPSGQGGMPVRSAWAVMERPSRARRAGRPLRLHCGNLAALRRTGASGQLQTLRCSKQHCYSMISSARPRSNCGTVRPSALAVLRLRISSTFVDCWTGRSAGFSPLRMRPV